MIVDISSYTRLVGGYFVLDLPRYGFNISYMARRTEIVITSIIRGGVNKYKLW